MGEVDSVRKAGYVLIEAIGNACVVQLIREGPTRLIPEEWHRIEDAALALKYILDQDSDAGSSD